MEERHVEVIAEEEKRLVKKAKVLSGLEDEVAKSKAANKKVSSELKSVRQKKFKAGQAKLVLELRGETIEAIRQTAKSAARHELTVAKHLIAIAIDALRSGVVHDDEMRLQPFVRDAVKRYAKCIEAWDAAWLPTARDMHDKPYGITVGGKPAP